MKEPGVYRAILIEMYKHKRTIPRISRNLDRQKILQTPRETQNHESYTKIRHQKYCRFLNSDTSMKMMECCILYCQEKKKKRTQPWFPCPTRKCMCIQYWISHQSQSQKQWKIENILKIVMKKKSEANSYLI